MTDQLNERVSEILADVDAESDSILSASTDESTRDLLETATEARELVESTEPDALLEAVDLDALPDGSEPETVPEAIAEGDPGRVDDLQRLLNLAALADREADDDVFEGALGDLRDRLEASAGDGDADERDADDRGADESDESDEGDGDDGPLEGRLQSVLDGSGSVGDELRQIKGRLEDSMTDDESAADESEAAGEDDGLLGDDGALGGDEGVGSSSGGSTRHSTMAPSPSERPDMRTPTRHSTMPDKDD